MAAPKRTAFQRENDYERITTFYLRGWRQVDIAAELGLSQGQISQDLKTIQKRWRTDTAINLDEAKQKELARLDELEREFWQAWETSKGERTKARQEKNVSGTTVKASMEKEQRDGNPAFLQGVLNCIQKRCDILGLDAPKRNNNLEVDLSKLTDDQLSRVANGEDPFKVIMDDYLIA